jgi:sugar phosphate permease
VGALTLSGVGFGLAFSSFQLAALASAEVSIAGAASGVMSTVRYVGSIVGTSLLAGPLAPDPKSTNFRPVFVMTAVAALGAAALATVLPRVIHAEDGDSPEITATIEDGATVSP